MSTQRLARTMSPGLGRRTTATPFSLFNSAYIALLLVFFAAVGGLLYWGGSYYATPLIERSHHPLHALLRPSGRVGLSLGIAGAVMMLLIFLYTLRKRSSFLQKIGTQSQWLKLHIFLGFAGPILVTIHTSGKLNGLVAVGFYAMWCVVASGIIGRYIYAKIPRTLSGNQMTEEESEVGLADVTNMLRASENKDVVLDGIERFLSRARSSTRSVSLAVGRVILDDLRYPVSALTVWRIVGADESLSFSARARVSRLVLRQQRMLNKLSVLEAMKSVFSYWHIFHKPFTVVTFVVLLVHVAVVAFFGGIHW